MKLTINNTSVDAVRSEIVQSDEKVNTYLLKDGTVVKVRCILTGIWALTGEKDMNGNQAYHFNWQVIATSEPED